MRDLLYSEQRGQVGRFEFNEEVASVFPDMIERSVPGYELGLSMMEVLGKKYAQVNSNCYDLGCSLGGVTLAVRKGIDKEDCRIIAVDNSEAMVEKCKINVKNDKSIDVVFSDICDIEFERASIVVLNFTLQFIDISKRNELLSKIYKAMLPGGVLVISEKIAFADKEEQKLQDELHCEFKKINQYSELEIEQKRTALENVLKPETIDAHYERLRQVGFEKIYTWFCCLNFVSIVSKKE